MAHLIVLANGFNNLYVGSFRTIFVCKCFGSRIHGTYIIPYYPDLRKMKFVIRGSTDLKISEATP
ncbi:hypothetical protein Psfp_03826 [Pelotomaculum sp. FP]|nr:hypothetical protein Psfp_03826 [Pelotomaculum sp. FP]